jgi:hAT family C-terminal dimerisation region
VAQLNETVFPTLFKIAMDYLPIQASSVPSERVFSSSAETDTKKRNCIHPILMEALQMLKFALKKERFDFMQGWMTSESILCDEEPDGIDLLSRLLGEVNKEDVIDEIIRDFGEDDGTP